MQKKLPQNIEWYRTIFRKIKKNKTKYKIEKMKFWPINLLYSGTWLVFQLILILICDKFSVNGQGIRGVIINNQKLDNSDGINLLVSNGYSTTSAPVSSTTPLTTKV